MVRDLRLRKGRERRGLALAEGVRLVEEAIATATPIRAALVTASLEATPRGRALKESLVAGSVRIEEVSADEMEALATTEHPQGVLAVLEPKTWTLADLPSGPGTTLLVFDAVQDPGNVGTLIRTALALGADGVVALPGTVELTNPKALRATMGAAFRLPAATPDEASFLTWCKEHDVRLWVTTKEGIAMRGREGDSALALVVGNEGAGVRASLRAVAARSVAIPIHPEAESLNVAVAAGILLYEVTRAG